MWWLYNPKCPCVMTFDVDYGRHFTRDHPWRASHVFRDTTSVLRCCKKCRRRSCLSLYPLSPVLSSRSVVCLVRVRLKHDENVSRFIARKADDSNLLLTGFALTITWRGYFVTYSSDKPVDLMLCETEIIVFC
jgi:hypothetical protein